MIFVTINAVRLITAFFVTIEEVYEVCTKIKWDTAEDVILKYLQDRIGEDIIALFNGEFDENKQDKDPF